jgi:hypothetical protein
MPGHFFLMAVQRSWEGSTVALCIDSDVIAQHQHQLSINVKENGMIFPTELEKN